ncbi:MAG: hypothetical protein ACLPXB_13545 [Thiobacillaceae bacterium]
MITVNALAWCIASTSVEEGDELNILRATLLALHRAIAGLGYIPELALVDRK